MPVTKEDVKILREYLRKANEIRSARKDFSMLTREEWDEILASTQETGEIPAKYASRVGTKEILDYTQIENGKSVYHPEGIKRKVYFDIEANEYWSQLTALNDKYQQTIDKILVAALSEDNNKQEHTAQSIEDVIELILSSPEVLEELEEVRRQTQQGSRVLGLIPNTPIIELLYNVGATKNYNALKDTNTDVDYNEQTDTLTITRTVNKKNSTKSIIKMKRPTIFFGKYNVSFLRILTFTLEKLVQQNFPPAISFSLQEMIDLKMYTAASSAWRAIKDFIGKQKDFELSGELRQGKTTIAEQGGILFYNYKRTGDYIQIAFNTDFNKEFLASYYTIMPRFAYGLKNGHAFLLTRYIFYMARQRTENIKGKCKFNISMEKIREALGLPAVGEIKNRAYKQLIIDPIEDAIEDIETALQDVPEADDYKFTITPYKTDTSNIVQWLKEGYIEIGLKDTFAQNFTKIAASKESQKAKQAAATRRAIANLIAKQQAAQQTPAN